MLKSILRIKGLTNPSKCSNRTIQILSGNHNADHYMADMCSIPGDVKPPTVIIIGAGVAGLSAAQRLVQCGITTFRILEATERAGGRVKTCWIADTIAEMGAEYIFGASIANPIYTLATQERLLQAPLKRSQLDHSIFFTSKGMPIDGTTVKRVSGRYWTMEAKAAKLFQGSTTQESLSSYFDQLITLDLASELDRYNASRVFYGMMNLLSSRVGASLSKVSAKFFGSQAELPGGITKVRLGMNGILAPLVRGLPHCSEVYCKPVHCIKWGTAGDGCPRAVVRCCDGEEFCGDYVIVTVPLGVLKKNADTLFCPPLPGNKMDAIKNLGFGHVGKVYLEYPRPFWAGDYRFNLAWAPEELKKQDTWVKGISEFRSVSRKVLCATVAGEAGALMENCCDNVVAEHATIALRRFLRDASVPVPSYIIRTDWSSNPYFYGGITYMNLKSSVGNIRDIGDPIPCDCDDIPPIILFAGEHTHPRFYGTLHGARLSGIREADRIIKLTKKFKGPPTQSPPCKSAD